MPQPEPSDHDWYNARIELHNSGFYDLPRTDLYRRVECVVMEHQMSQASHSAGETGLCGTCGDPYPCRTRRWLVDGEPA